jgi:uncharacterized protein (TIGR00255 family)
MLRSMTGFGSAAGQVESVSYVVEVRSVNNRYLKISCKLPDFLAATESEIETLVRHRVQRGTLTLSVQTRLPEDRAAGRVNTAVLSNYLDQLRMIDVEGNPMLRVDLAALMQLPGVCEPPSLEGLVESTRDGLLALVAQAIEDLAKMRRKEGDNLKADLLGNCDETERNLAAIAEVAPKVVVDYHDRLALRVAELTRAAKINIDEDMLAREVAIFADRCDIAEEITRLRAHVEQFRQTVDSPEPAGRKLDFIAQEMLREANTIASKANSAEIGRHVVDIKTAIDRIKEQVQNVE